ncbi:MAG TPA: phage holin family protein [Bryobacteraceae bacterium]|nr:phage holin family protein [Bryobacteraceae bacterium]
MAHLLLNWILSALILLLLAQLLPGFRIAGAGSALVAVVLIALINATLGLAMRAVAFPLTLITFGLFILVIDAIVLKIAAALMPGFSIRGFVPALVAAGALSLLHILLRFGFSHRPFHGISA